jgi:hypothetical protein
MHLPLATSPGYELDAGSLCRREAAHIRYLPGRASRFLFFPTLPALTPFSPFSIFPRTCCKKSRREVLWQSLGHQLSLANSKTLSSGNSEYYGHHFRRGFPKGLCIARNADSPVDLAIPGAPYSFSQLHRAVVLGENRCPCPCGPHRHPPASLQSARIPPSPGPPLRKGSTQISRLKFC